MDQKNILTQALYFLQKQRRHRWWLRAVTGMAAVVVFITTYLLILPAITMENSTLEVTATPSLAALGETIDTEIYATADNGRSETTFVLEADGDNAGLDESQFDFDDDDVAVVRTIEGQDIELHREYTVDGIARYWFTLGEGESVHFSLSWVNGADHYRTEEIEEEVPVEEPEEPDTVLPEKELPSEEIETPEEPEQPDTIPPKEEVPSENGSISESPETDLPETNEPDATLTPDESFTDTEEQPSVDNEETKVPADNQETEPDQAEDADKLEDESEHSSAATGNNAVYAAVNFSHIYQGKTFVRTAGTGRLSLSRHEVPLVASADTTATDSNAQPDEEPEISTPEHESSSDIEGEGGIKDEGGSEDEDAVEDDMEEGIEDEPDYEIVYRTETVLDQEGDSEQGGSLILSFGCGQNKEDAQTHTDDSLTLSWAEEELPLEIPEDASSWATVEKEGFTATDSDAAMLALLGELEEAEGESYDFSEDITKVTVSKLENDQWKPGTEFTDGDSVRVNIDYSLQEGIVGSGNKEIHYQMPDGITLNEETGGTVYDGSTPVGTYTITEDGLIRIIFNDDFADDRPFTGTIQFQGTAHAGESGEDHEIDFGAGGSIIVKPNPKPTDVQVKKEGSYSKEDGKLHYALTVSTTQGTSGAITVNDAFQAGGNTPVYYDKDSFQIVKVDAAGQTTPVTGYTPAISTDGWDGAPEKFTIAGLPELKAGESYRITYTATPEKPSNTTGESSVNNSVGVTTEGGDNSYNGCTITIFNKMIAKEGKYDDVTGMIDWTITLNPDKRDIGGWVLKDTITANGVTVTMPEQVTITGSDGESQEITLPYTFPDGSTDSYTITYQTPVEGLKPGEKPTVTNNATIDGDGEHYEGGTTVGPSAKEYHVWKTNGWHDVNQDSGSLGTYQWNLGIDVPASVTETDLDSILYTDKLYPVTAAGGAEIPDSHYITAQQLGALAPNQGLIRGTDYVICDPDGNEITDFSSDTRYTGFQIRFTASALEKIRGKSVNITYYSTVDYTKLTDSGKYTFKNWGSIPGHETESTQEYEKPPKLEKQASATGNSGSFTGGGVEVDYTASGGVIHYRLLLHTDASTKGAITVIDRLPRGAKLVEDSVKLAFYSSDYYDYGDISLPDGSKYTASEHIKTSVGAVNTDGTTPVTFTIDDGYNGDGTFHTLVLYYDLSIKDDPIWAENPGLESHLYRNEVSWDGESTGTDVTVDRDVPKLAKTGVQLPQYDENGNPLLDENGNPILSNTVRYYVTINQGAQDLDPVRDVLELKDTLTLPNNVAGAELNVGSVRLYRFDANAENHCGEAVNPARYSYIYDQATHTLTFTVPDSMAMVLVYEYTIDRGQAAGDLQLSNKAALTGVAGGSTEDNIQFQEITSSATVTKRTLTIYKVDGENFGKNLPGAEFRLDVFSGSEWTTEEDNLVTDQDGLITLNMTDENGQVRYQPDILYQLTETKAPNGYAPDSTPNYFVWIGTGETVDQCKEKMTEILRAAKVSADDVLFITNSSAIYVPNTSTTLTVQKVWIDPDGGEMENPDVDSIEVKLWQQPVKTNAVTVTFHNQQGNLITSTDVAFGSNLTVKVSAWSSFDYTVNGGSKQTAVSANGNASFALTNLTDNTTVAIDGYFDASNFTFTGYTAPYYTPTGEKSEYATVTLNAENGWSYTWTDLPQTNSDGQRLHYTVEESPVPDGFHVIYSPNNQNGIQTGELVITNQSNGYVLPETGGTGTIPFTAGGLAFFALAGLMYITLWRKGGQQAL